MPHLTAATYNTYRERKGRDPALDALLSQEKSLSDHRLVRVGLEA